MAETCPKCGSTRVQNDECLQCGIYLSKYRAHLLKMTGVPQGAPGGMSAGAPAGPMPEIGYKILGDDIQLVEIELDPGNTAVAEPGAMLYAESGINMETIAGGILSAGTRLLAGESLFLTSFSNMSGQIRRVAFAAPLPGKIFAVRLSDVGGALLAQRGVFLAGAHGVNITIAFQKKFGAGLMGGTGFILQRLEGDGMVFVAGAGAVCTRQLEPGETLRVQTGAIVAFEQTVSYDIEYVGSIKSALFGGQGLFFASLTGPGRLWLQSPAMTHLAQRSSSSSTGGGVTSHGATSAAGSLLGSLFGGGGGGSDERSGGEQESGGSTLGGLFGGGGGSDSDNS